MSRPSSHTSSTPPPKGRWTTFIIFAVVFIAALTFAITALLVSIIQRKQEAKSPYLKFVNVDENTTDPAVWGMNWPREYDGYNRTSDSSRTRYGGGESLPAQKLDRDPWLKTMFAGYAFAIDYRDRRGHAYMLYDQAHTERVLDKPQPGACVQCHASVIPTYRRIGIAALSGKPATGPDAGIDLGDSFDFNWPAVMKGFEIVSALSYTNARAELFRTPDGSDEIKGHRTPTGTDESPEPGYAPPTTQAATTQEAMAHQTGTAHPVSCVDCHDPKTMQLRVTRPGFIKGIAALAASDAPTPHLPSIERWRRGSRTNPYNPNTEASRQEMRSFSCGQCHVEYYCGPKETLFYPWNNGLKVEQIEQTYAEHKFPNGEPFYDFVQTSTGAHVLKAQHPEFEMWSQGIHARSGVACADCHMPYEREGALKISDHWVRSPLLNIARSCQTCHHVPEEDLLARVTNIQDKTRALIDRSAKAYMDMVAAVTTAKKNGATDDQLHDALELLKKAQWRLDFVYAENSMGFHASQETARILAESIDFARQAEISAMSLPSKTSSKAAASLPAISPTRISASPPLPSSPAS